MASSLFSPIRLADAEFSNRIVVAPMCQYSADDGCASEWHTGHLGMLANCAFMFGGRRDENGNGGGNIIASILIMILAPLAATVVQMAISRSREYAADRGGAEIAGQPMWLASALEKIHNAAHNIPNEDAERNPATAHMFIINPLTGSGMDNLFSTHPNTENRIAALEQMAAEMGQYAEPAPATQGRRGPWG